MQRLEVSGEVQHIYASLGFKGLHALCYKSDAEKYESNDLR